jgi:Xaa-Pro aminopeptidase
MNPRLNSFLEKIESSSLDGFLVSEEANVSYLCRYLSHDSYLLVSRKKIYFITDFRYIEEAQKNIRDAEVIKYRNLFKDIAGLAKRLKVRRLGFEAKDLCFAEHTKIKTHLGPKIKLIDTFNLIETLRQIKTSEELQDIRKAVDISAGAFRFIKGLLKPGETELRIVGELERFIRYSGSKSAFAAIVASGCSSSLPHAPISQKRLKTGEPVLIDMGVEVNGYKSDLTRVFFLGKIIKLQQRIYKIIKDAQGKAIEAVRPGVKISQIDRAARSYIEKCGYGKYFGHSLGHGVGLEVHEEPSISAKNHLPLKEGMVFTIEPGIYLPQKFGIRLEDMVLVTQRGCEVLSGAVNKSI